MVSRGIIWFKSNDPEGPQTGRRGEKIKIMLKRAVQFSGQNHKKKIFTAANSLHHNAVI